jgi:hypothetical protein
VVPYSTCEFDASFVVQDITALVPVMPELDMLLNTGAVKSGVAEVVNTLSPDTAGFPAASVDLTR